MTLILSHVSTRFTMQVSDRLVMRPQADKDPVPFDNLANKSVIYCARDAIVSMAYTGPAHVGSLPTDSWIVQKLTGVDVSQDFGIHIGLAPQWFDIGQAMRVLLQELRGSEIAKHAYHFELIAVGWQWKIRKRAMEDCYNAVPMLWQIQKPRDSLFPQDVACLPRYWHYCSDKSFFGWTPKDNLSKSEVQNLFSRIRDAGPVPTGEEMARLVEKESVETIRRMSKVNPYVGPHCMSVILAPPHQSARILVSFSPNEQHTAQLITGTLPPITLPATYSPWIVTKGSIHKPQVRVGCETVDSAWPFLIEYHGSQADSDHRFFQAMSSQKRPPRPTK